SETLAGDLVGFTAPDGSDVRPVLGVGDVPIPGQLVALVSVLTAALPVALAGDGADPAARFSVLAGGQSEVDGGEDVVDPLGVVFQAAGVEEDAGGGGSPQLGRLFDAGGG